MACLTDPPCARQEGRAPWAEPVRLAEHGLYLSFLGFQLPQNYALQRFPVGKWVSVNIFVWSIALLCHAAAKSFGTLLVCRFFLGIAEGAITPGFMIITSMFYTRAEQTRRVGYWCE